MHQHQYEQRSREYTQKVIRAKLHNADTPIFVRLLARSKTPTAKQIAEFQPFSPWELHIWSSREVTKMEDKVCGEPWINGQRDSAAVRLYFPRTGEGEEDATATPCMEWTRLWWYQLPGQKDPMKLHYSPWLALGHKVTKSWDAWKIKALCQLIFYACMEELSWFSFFCKRFHDKSTAIGLGWRSSPVAMLNQIELARLRGAESRHDPRKWFSSGPLMGIPRTEHRAQTLATRLIPHYGQEKR